MSRARDLADGTFSGAFSADSPTLVVDDTNNRVGIGIASPSSLLDVDKSQNAETNIELTNTNTGSAAQVRTKYTTDGGLFTVGKTSNAHVYGGDAYIHNVDNTNIRFATNDTERARFDSNGHLILKKNLVLESTSEGIDFSGVGSSAQTLDSYEEGTWTPTWGGTTSDGSVTYNVQNGYYTKVGRLVTLRGTIGITAISTSPSGYLLIKGFPFSNLSGSETVGNVGYGSCFTGGTFPDAIHIANNSTSCYLYYSSSQGSAMVNSNSGSTLTTGVLYFALTYQTN